MKKFKKISDLLPNHDHGQSQSYNSRHASNHWTEESFDFLSLLREWPELVGKTLGEQTVPGKILGKTLILYTKHPGFAQKLSFMHEMILEKMNKKFPSLRNKVNSLKFQNSPHLFEQKMEVQRNKNVKERQAKPKEFNKFSPEFKKFEAEAKQLFQHLPEEFKEQFISIYIQLKIR